MVLNEYVFFKLDEEKEFIVLNNSSIEVYTNNVVIECSNHMIEFTHLYNHNKPNRRLKPIHLISRDNLLVIILYSPYIEEIKMDVDSYGGVRTKINIISDHIENFKNTSVLLRKSKIEKIIKKINVRKKSL
jgi:hypothetical protein